MTEEERLACAAYEKEKFDRECAVNAAIRAHYLNLPGKTNDGWVDVLKDPSKFNLVWRHMLKHACGQRDLDINRFPPPIDLQSLLPRTDRAHDPK